MHFYIIIIDLYKRISIINWNYIVLNLTSADAYTEYHHTTLGKASDKIVENYLSFKNNKLKTKDE